MLAALRARGDRLAVVSNWDVSLHDVLERTRLRGARRRGRRLGDRGRGQARPGDLRAGAGGARRARRGRAARRRRPRRRRRRRARRGHRRGARRPRRRARAPDGVRAIAVAGRAARAVAAPRTLCRNVERGRLDPAAAVGVGPRPAPAPRRGAGDDPGWRPITSLFALLAGFGGAIVGAIVVGLIAGLFGASLTDPPPSVAIIGTVVQDVCLVAAALFFARLAARPRPSHFGLRAARLWPAVGWAALAYATFYAFTAAWVALLGTKPVDENLPKQLGADKSTVALIAVALLVSVVAPMCRGVLLPRLLLRRAAQLERAGRHAHHRAGLRRHPRRVGPVGVPAARWRSSARRCAGCASGRGRCIPGSCCTAPTTRSPSACRSTGAGRSACCSSALSRCSGSSRSSIRTRWDEAAVVPAA